MLHMMSSYLSGNSKNKSDGWWITNSFIQSSKNADTYSRVSSTLTSSISNSSKRIFISPSYSIHNCCRVILWPIIWHFICYSSKRFSFWFKSSLLRYSSISINYWRLSRIWSINSRFKRLSKFSSSKQLARSL